MKKWIQMGFDEGTLKHRQLLSEKILSYSPETILDVGCATGPDIALLLLKQPDLKITGFDQDPKNIEQTGSLNATVYQGDLQEELLGIPDKKFDVVFSNGVIMYVGAPWIKEMIRIAKKTVILSERDPEQNMLNYIKNELGLQVKETKVTEDIRDSWKQDGYIYELCLN